MFWLGRSARINSSSICPYCEIMNGKIYKWCCKNPECEMKNLSEDNGIDEASEKDLKLMLICAGCGFVETPVKIGTKNSEDYLHDIPFKGFERRLPAGRNPNWTFVDYQGKSFDRRNFIMRYGVDPERYLKWKDAGKPKPTNKS